MTIHSEENKDKMKTNVHRDKYGNPKGPTSSSSNFKYYIDLHSKLIITAGVH